MLRRLAGGPNIHALETLVGVIEPVKIYQRFQQRRQTMLSPLTGLIDAAQADAPDARRFNRAVSELLAGRDVTANAELIQSMLTRWRAATGELRSVMENSPALAEARPLVGDLGALTEIAQSAFDELKISRLSAGGNASLKTAQWRDTQLAKLTEAAKPKAAVEFVIVASIRKMVVEVSAK
jgi:hypothetical protein